MAETFDPDDIGRDSSASVRHLVSLIAKQAGIGQRDEENLRNLPVQPENLASSAKNIQHLHSTVVKADGQVLVVARRGSATLRSARARVLNKVPVELDRMIGALAHLALEFRLDELTVALDDCELAAFLVIDKVIDVKLECRRQKASAAC